MPSAPHLHEEVRGARAALRAQESAADPSATAGTSATSVPPGAGDPADWRRAARMLVTTASPTTPRVRTASTPPATSHGVQSNGSAGATVCAPASTSAELSFGASAEL